MITRTSYLNSVQRCVMLVSIFLALHGLGPYAVAQVQRVIPERTAPNQWAGEETAEETIAAALEDLASRNPDDRKRAVLVLGKYEHPRAMIGLARSLTDDVAVVRRNALVSIAEHPQWLGRLSQLILARLGDSDVHTRRIASSVLPQTMVGFLTVRSVNPAGAVARPQREAPFSPQLSKVIQAAFTDPDATVRKNMLTYHHYFIELLTPALIKPLLTDQEREIRMLALQAAQRVLSDEEFSAAAKPLVHDDDTLVRLQVARMLGRIYEVSSLELLQEMTADDDAQVVGEAVLGVIRRGAQPEHTTVKQFLAREDVDTRTGSMIIAALPNLGAAAEQLLKDHFTHRWPEYRAAAFHGYASAFASGRDPEDFIPFLGDPSQQVRQAVLRVLSRCRGLATSEIRQMMNSEHPDVRVHAVRGTEQLGKDEAASILNDLIFDESNEVRRNAVMMMAKRQVPGWLKVTKLSLRDPDDAIQRTAAMALATSNEPGADEALDAFLQETENEKLKDLMYQIRQQQRAAKARAEKIRQLRTPE